MADVRNIVILAAKWYIDKHLHKKRECGVNRNKL